MLNQLTHQGPQSDVNGDGRGTVMEQLDRVWTHQGLMHDAQTGRLTADSQSHTCSGRTTSPWRILVSTVLSLDRTVNVITSHRTTSHSSLPPAA